MSSTNLPLLFTASGPITTPPATLQQAIITYVQSVQPGYTANLPGSLIDDISGTDVGALSAIDQARVDCVNAVTPYGSNAFILAQLGAMFGLPQGQPSNGNVYVVFTGTPGYVIPPGFLIGDGTYTYVIQDGGVIGAGGTSASLFAVSTSGGTYPIAANTVTVISTTVPNPYTLTVTNPLAGVPANALETVESYRSRLLTAFQGPIQGWQANIKTLLNAVPGVTSRLVSIIPNGTNWEVICGGGDPYQVAGAIYSGTSNIGWIVGSAISSGRNITASIYDAPDTYTVVFVNPPQIATTVAVTWNTTLTDFTASAAVNQFIITAVQSYINGILVGQPVNLLVMTEAIQNAVSSVLAAINLTTLTFVVKMNSVTQSPTAGTSIIPALDNESYLYISPSGATSVQG